MSVGENIFCCNQPPATYESMFEDVLNMRDYEICVLCVHFPFVLFCLPHIGNKNGTSFSIHLLCQI